MVPAYKYNGKGLAFRSSLYLLTTFFTTPMVPATVRLEDCFLNNVAGKVYVFRQLQTAHATQSIRGILAASIDAGSMNVTDRTCATPQSLVGVFTANAEVLASATMEYVSAVGVQI